MTSLGTAVAEVLIDTLTSAARIAEPDGHDLGEIMNALTDLLAALTDLLAALTDDRGRHHRDGLAPAGGRLVQQFGDQAPPRLYRLRHRPPGPVAAVLADMAAATQNLQVLRRPGITAPAHGVAVMDLQAPRPTAPLAPPVIPLQGRPAGGRPAAPR